MESLCYAIVPPFPLAGLSCRRNLLSKLPDACTVEVGTVLRAVTVSVKYGFWLRPGSGSDNYLALSIRLSVPSCRFEHTISRSPAVLPSSCGTCTGFYAFFLSRCLTSFLSKIRPNVLQITNNADVIADSALLATIAATAYADDASEEWSIAAFRVGETMFLFDADWRKPFSEAERLDAFQREKFCRIMTLVSSRPTLLYPRPPARLAMSLGRFPGPSGDAIVKRTSGKIGFLGGSASFPPSG